MEIFTLVCVVLFLIFLGVGIEKEWNGFLLVVNLVVFPITLILCLSTKELPSFIFGFIAFGTFWGACKVFFRSRCPSCKKFFAATKLNDELIQHGDIYYKNQSDSSREAWQKNLYRRDYVCKHCQHQWSRNISRDEKV